MDELLRHSRLFKYVRHQFATAAPQFKVLNVCFCLLDVTAADSRPVHLPEAECQGIMRHLVVKFRIWQNALKPSRLQMQREQPGQSDDFPFLTNYIIFPFASRQTNDQIVQRRCHCLDTDSYCLSYQIHQMYLTKAITSRVALLFFCIWPAGNFKAKYEKLSLLCCMCCFFFFLLL